MDTSTEGKGAFDFAAFVPPAGVASLVAVFSVSRFEAGPSRVAGMRGSSELIGFLVDVTFGIASTFAIAFLIAFLWDYGWQTTLTIILASLLASAIWSWLVRDNLFVWVLGTIACWALMAVLVRQVSWFGFFN